MQEPDILSKCFLVLIQRSLFGFISVEGDFEAYSHSWNQSLLTHADTRGPYHSTPSNWDWLVLVQKNLCKLWPSFEFHATIMSPNCSETCESLFCWLFLVTLAINREPLPSRPLDRGSSLPLGPDLTNIGMHRFTPSYVRYIADRSLSWGESHSEQAAMRCLVPVRTQYCNFPSKKKYFAPWLSAILGWESKSAWPILLTIGSLFAAETDLATESYAA